MSDGHHNLAQKGLEAPLLGQSIKSHRELVYRWLVLPGFWGPGSQGTVVLLLKVFIARLLSEDSNAPDD